MKNQLRFLTTLCILALTTITANAFDYYITFTGSGASTTVDSVVVQNLSKITQVTVPSGIKLRLYDTESGIDDFNATSNLAFVYPNPTTGNATYTFTAKYAGKTQIGVFGLDGRKVAGLDADLQQGKNSFQLELPNGVYLVQVKGNGFSYTTKTISLSMINDPPKITFTGNTTYTKPQRAPAPEVKLQYSIGDQLLYKGYSGNHCTIVTDKPIETKTTDFKFVECTDADGNHYAVVHIGTQTWMAENLKTTKYSNGEAIGTTIPVAKDIRDETEPKYQWAFSGNENDASKYGRLFTWHAANDSRKIAPTGWHVPNVTEWTELENYLIANGNNYDGTTTGNKIAKSLAANTDWYTSTNTGSIGNDLIKNNDSGFTALPGGARYDIGLFSYVRDSGYWWSSTEDISTKAWYRFLAFNMRNLNIYRNSKGYGFSVRCVKDKLPNLTTISAISSNESIVSSGGNISDDGGSVVTARGVCWCTNHYPTIADSKTTDGTGTGSFTSTITGLTLETKYYIRAYATNSVGTSYGNEVGYSSQLTPNEQKVIDKVDDFMPEQVLFKLEDHLETVRNEPNYTTYLDSIEKATDDLISTIEQDYTLDDFKSTFDSVVNILENSNYNAISGLNKDKSNFENHNSLFDGCLGLGYSKGLRVDVSVSGNMGAIMVAGLQTAGGGGIKIVYDFVNQDRQIYYYTICSYGISYSSGLAAGLTGSIGFTGINELITGIKYHSNSSGINKFEGTSIGKSSSLSGSLMAALGLKFSTTIGYSSSAYGNLSGIANLLPCPYNLVILENGTKTYSFAVKGSLGYGPSVELLLSCSNNQIGSNTIGIFDSYKTFNENRILSGLKMAKEITLSNPLPGISASIAPENVAAASLAIYFSYKDFSSCPSTLATIGTLPVNSITSNSATCGGVIKADGGSQITSRGAVWSTSENPTIDNYTGMKSNGNGIGEFACSMTRLINGITYYARAFATNSAGTAYGGQLSFTTKSDASTVTDIDGNVYHTVTIGTQTWMVENLNTSKYSNGETIPNITDGTEWTGLTTGAWCNYNNDVANGNKYGKLYNWYAVADSRNIAPAGWHVPTITEWAVLENYLIANGFNYDGTITGNKIAKSLASTTDWVTSTIEGAVGNDLTKNNKSDFTALPGGYRSGSSSSGIGTNAIWWSSTENDNSTAWRRSIFYTEPNMVNATINPKTYGRSIRLVKD